MKKTFGEKLKLLRERKEWTQDDLAQQLGTSKQVISRYENEQRTPKVTVAQSCADVFGVSLDYLINDEHVDLEEAYSWMIPITKQRIPLLGTIACGEPIMATEEFDSYVEADGDIQCDFALRAKGDSMINARICDGDIVFIRKQTIVDNGEIAAVLIDDEATLKRVYYNRSAQKLVLNAENSKYDPIILVGDELEQVRIIGKAVAFQSDVR